MHIFFKKITPLFLILILASCNFLAEGIKGSFSYGGSVIVMVDPYIEGATMCYDANLNDFCDPDEAESSPSDSKGKTQFAINLPNNARLIQKEKGVSNGKPFLGQLETDFEENYNIANPFTTLIANGNNITDLLNEINSSLTLSLTIDDLRGNPMEAVEKNDPTKLARLTVSMALSAHLASDPTYIHFSSTEIQTFYDSVNAVFSGSVPDTSTLKAATVVQEYLAQNPGADTTGLNITQLITAINIHGKEIKLDTPTSFQVLDVPAPKIVRLTDSKNYYQDNNPTITVGGIKAGDEITLFHDYTCMTEASLPVVSNGSSVNILADQNMSGDGYYQFYAKITNPAGTTAGTTACSTAFAKFEYDSNPPAAIGTADAQEPSTLDPITMPINYNFINVFMTGDFLRGETVRLYRDSTCSTRISSFYVANDAPDITFYGVYLPHGTHDLYVDAVDLAGNQLGCSHSTIPMLEVDNYAPPKPTSVARTAPAMSPTNNTLIDIQVNGVEANAWVYIFAGPNCVVANQIYGDVETAGVVSLINHDLISDGVYTFSAKVFDEAGNASACTNSNFTHVVDTTAPFMASNIVKSNPIGAIGNNQYPVFLISGVNPTDTVRIYDNDGSCTTSPVGMSIASTSSVLVASQILSESYHQIFTQSSDLAGNLSPCSSFYAEYTVDITAPTSPTAMNMHMPVTSPGNDTTPTILVNGVEVGATVKIYRNATCTQQVGSIVATDNTEYPTTNVLTPGSYTFYARQTDAAGNNSPCSTSFVSYTVDTTPPAAPTVNFAAGTTSPSGNITPTLAISNLEVGSTVHLFIDNSCTTSVGTFTANSSTQNFTVSPLNSGGPNYTFYTRVTDLAGNMRACTNSNKTYTLYRNLTGVAAIGGPLRYAEITIYGASGCRQNIGASHMGVYNFTNVTCTGPYLIKAQNVAATLYSVATESDLGGTVNITPLTELVMNRVYPGINYGSESAIDSTLTALNSTQAAVNSSIVAEKDAVKTALYDLFYGFSLSAADIIKTPFTANGSGMDALLNSVMVAPYPSTTDYAIAVKTTTGAPMVIPDIGSITDSLTTSPGLAPSVAADFTAIKSVLNNFDDCAIGVTSYPSATAQNCIDSYTHVDFMHDGNNREDFTLGISQEYVDFDLLVQFTDYHLMDMYTETINAVQYQIAEVMTYVSDYNVSTNPDTLLHSYVESYKMIKISGVWKVAGNQLPLDIQAMPSKMFANGQKITGYEIMGGFNDPGDTLNISVADSHFTGYTNISLNEANYNGYQHLNVAAGSARATECTGNTVHCNNFFKMPNGVRRPNFLKVDINYYDSIGMVNMQNSIMLPAYKDVSPTEFYATFNGLPSPLCGTNINLPSFAINSMPGMYSVMGWSVVPTTSTPLYIDYANMDWWNTSNVMNLLYWDGTDPSGLTTTDFSEVHATVYIATPGGERRGTNVSCGYP